MKPLVRRSRRFLPRFGIAFLFAAMLLAISAGGWWKFYRDLYLEEQAVLAELAEEECKATYLRVPNMQDAVEESGDDSGNRYFDRIRILFIEGNPSPETLRGAALLPKLDLLYVRREPPVAFTAPSPAYTTDALIGGAAPEFAMSELVDADLERPQPAGERMDEAERATTLGAIRSAWEAPSKTPTRFVRSVRRRQEGLSEDRTFARDADAALSYIRQDGGSIWMHVLQIGDGDTLYTLHDVSESWRLNSRDRETTRGFPTQRFDESDELIAWPYDLASRTDSAELAHVEGVERIDDVRVRLTFRPFERQGRRRWDAGQTIREASLVLREDLDWRPESIREMAGDWSIAEERRYERIGDYVLPIEILAIEKPSYVAASVSRCEFAWRIDATFDPGTFSPNRFLAEPIPPPQELPLWRWNYATLAAGLGLSIFLIGRKAFIFLRGKRRSTDPPVVPTPGA